MPPASRIALFGGSFDPPHRGHVAIARAAADAFGLNQVLFAPAGRQPLKPEGSWASFADRLAMTELACGEDPRFSASSIDAPRPDGQPNYTVSSLEALASADPGARLFNIVGMDSWLQLGRWQQPDRLLALAEWIVVSRPGVVPADPAGLMLTRAQKERVHHLNWVNEDVSATELRSLIQHGRQVDSLLPEPVARYIKVHHLYRFEESAR